ncbi:MAG: hypothetical protein J6S94_04795 [Bacteroidaceae bacterium]|nr:hypothetical protein [Bacteroidaceae bacterium]
MKPFLLHKTVKKGWVWLKRFRHRKGYGVHSPFAYDFITRVIYGKLSKAERRALQVSSKNRKESRKVMALLQKLEKEASSLVYVNQADPIYINNVYEEKAEKMGARDMMVIYGIYLNKDMKQVWQKLVVDDRSGITFDLYDVGIILFDKKITKQDYIVNF